MSKALKLLCVHGVGQHTPGGKWETEWREAITTGFDNAGADVELDIEFCHYDDIFADYDISLADTIEAVGKLMGSAVTSPFRTKGAAGALRWTAGMVVQWVENGKLRQRTRQRLAQRIKETQPDAVIAHSLGTLVSYDTFTDAGLADLIKDRVFITLGSQIGNPFVTGNFRAGRLEPLDQAAYWYHLYNKEDAVFTAPIRLSADNYAQVDTFFDEAGMADHNALRYLAHPSTSASAWTHLALAQQRPRMFAPAPARKRAVLPRPPQRRALIVGINDYPERDMKLEGCVNDAFLMSSVLQGAGFEAENIRMVLDKRATAQGIFDRLEWLFDGVREGDQRVFYYSGHGAQMSTYGKGDRVDQMDESLVPYNFDWTADRAVTDDKFSELYTQLPYGVDFLAVLDCCHSGGMTRGGMPRIRGLNPPDDIRHRSLYWNEAQGLWLERDIEPINADFVAEKATSKRPRMTRRLGHAMNMRGLAKSDFDKLSKAQGHHGPYMPILFYACREDEYAYEYRHGNVSHGAFTFALAKNLRAQVKEKKRQPSFADLENLVAKDLVHLGYEQHCVLVGPKAKLKLPVPFPGGKTGRRR